MSRLLHRMLVPVTIIASTVAAVAVAGAAPASASTPTLAFQSLGVTYSPKGASPTNWYNRPSLAAAYVKDPAQPKPVMRLFRSVTMSTEDRASVAIANVQNQYVDVGSGKSWQPMSFSSLGNRATMNNFVQNGNTLYTFDQIAINYTFHTSKCTFSNPTFAAVRRWSADGGRSWKTGWSTVDMRLGSEAWHGASCQVYLYQGIVTVGSTWLMPVYYGTFPTNGGKPHVRAGILESTNQGASWKRVVETFSSQTTDYTESTLVQAPDGYLLMASRMTVPGAGGKATPLGALIFRRSKTAVGPNTDFKTLGWTTITPALPQTYVLNGFRLGSSPRLTRIDGRLLLVYGRPGNMVTVSTDSHGFAFTAIKQVNPNFPSGGTCRYGAHPTGWDYVNDKPAYNAMYCEMLGSSGYMGVAVVNDNSTSHWGYLVGDRCHIWSCEKPVDPRTNPQGNWPDVQWNAPYTDQGVWMEMFRVSG